MTRAWVAGTVITACKSIICRTRHSSIKVSDQVRVDEYIHPDACFALVARGYPCALCPCCALLLDVLNREQVKTPFLVPPRRPLYRCERLPCDATFEHPDQDYCDRTINGWCAHLIEAGWQPVRVRVSEDAEDELVFSRGGWVCPKHAHTRCRHVMAGTTGEHCWLAAGHSGDHVRSPNPHQQWGVPTRKCFSPGHSDPTAPHGFYCGLLEGHDGPHSYTIPERNHDR